MSGFVSTRGLMKEIEMNRSERNMKRHGRKTDGQLEEGMRRWRGSSVFNNLYQTYCILALLQFDAPLSALLRWWST